MWVGVYCGDDLIRFISFRRQLINFVLKCKLCPSPYHLPNQKLVSEDSPFVHRVTFCLLFYLMSNVFHPLNLTCVVSPYYCFFLEIFYSMRHHYYFHRGHHFKTIHEPPSKYTQYENQIPLTSFQNYLPHYNNPILSIAGGTRFTHNWQSQVRIYIHILLFFCNFFIF